MFTVKEVLQWLTTTVYIDLVKVFFCLLETVCNVIRYKILIYCAIVQTTWSAQPFIFTLKTFALLSHFTCPRFFHFSLWEIIFHVHVHLSWKRVYKSHSCNGSNKLVTSPHLFCVLLSSVSFEIDKHLEVFFFMLV